MYRVILGAFLAAIVFEPPLAHASAVQFWLGGEDPVTLKDKKRSLPDDFVQLFDNDARWQRSALQTTVFKISIQFASGGTQSDLSALIRGLQQRHIGLALETGILRNDRGCGKGEGYIPEDLLRNALKRIQKLGGKVDYVAMDEVTFFGHEKSWPDHPGQVPCRDDLKEIVSEVAEKIILIHGIFPDAKIGAVEPITSNNGMNVASLVQDYTRFADLYRRATGQNLAFMHADIAWRSKGWLPALAPLKAAMASRGIRFGIIIGGNPDFKDDVSWTRAGLGWLRKFASDAATSPDDVIIQSWQPLPTHYLPESTPGTTTWMLLQAQQMVH